eukprot:354318-Chlamydomonas_euryale.AAC.3
MFLIRPALARLCLRVHLALRRAGGAAVRARMSEAACSAARRAAARRRTRSGDGGGGRGRWGGGGTRARAHLTWSVFCRTGPSCSIPVPGFMPPLFRRALRRKKAAAPRWTRPRNFLSDWHGEVAATATAWRACRSQPFPRWVARLVGVLGGFPGLGSRVHSATCGVMSRRRFARAAHLWLSRAFACVELDNTPVLCRARRGGLHRHCAVVGSHGGSTAFSVDSCASGERLAHWQPQDKYHGAAPAAARYRAEHAVDVWEERGAARRNRACRGPTSLMQRRKAAAGRLSSSRAAQSLRKPEQTGMTQQADLASAACDGSTCLNANREGGSTPLPHVPRVNLPEPPTHPHVGEGPHRPNLRMAVLHNAP